MFIDRNMPRTMRRSEERRLNWSRTSLDTFRSSERRRRGIGLRAINISLLRSEPANRLTLIPFKGTSTFKVSTHTHRCRLRRKPVWRSPFQPPAPCAMAE